MHRKPSSRRRDGIGRARADRYSPAPGDRRIRYRPASPVRMARSRPDRLRRRRSASIAGSLTHRDAARRAARWSSLAEGLDASAKAIRADTSVWACIVRAAHEQVGPKEQEVGLDFEGSAHERPRGVTTRELTIAGAGCPRSFIRARHSRSYWTTCSAARGREVVRRRILRRRPRMEQRDLGTNTRGESERETGRRIGARRTVVAEHEPRQPRGSGRGACTRWRNGAS
jgi:hypothetical protein